MLTRRSITALIGITGVLVAAPPMARRARAQAGDRAVTFVQSTAGQLVAVVNSADPPKEKRLKLQQVIDATVDVDDIAHFCLGRFWRLATPEQQQQYLALFGDLLVTKIAGHLGEYQGVRVTMGLARSSEDTEIVITHVDRPGNPTYQVDWVVSTTTGSPKIVDLLAEGTSLRLTQGSDFTAYLAHHQYNIHELIEAMRQLTAQNG
jgi:phospholipid transport system substrate-binding protein